MATSQPPLPKFLQEDQLTQECRELLPSLPKEKWFLYRHVYKYQGFWYDPYTLQGVLPFQNHFQAQDSDIFLADFPKSGTTWLKAILLALLYRSCCHGSQEKHPLLTNNPHTLVPNIERQCYAYNPTDPDLCSFTSPRLFHSHLALTSLPKSINDLQCKIVYLCRNPKDNFVSLWHFKNKLTPPNMGLSSLLEEFFDKFCEGVSLYGPYWDHLLGYWKESLTNPRRIYFLKYEEMKEQPSLHVRKLAEFLDCPFSTEEKKEGVVEDIIRLCSFDSLSNMQVNKEGKLPSGLINSAFFRRGEVGDWKNYLTAEMADRLDKITEEKLAGSGLKFEVS